MEKDALRRHVYDEVQSQFETKLREAKRQKSQVEEELESSSEKWRSERRRLNTEIDRLEAALADAKDSRKKAGPKGGRGTETDELTKLQAVSEEKVKKASQEWLKERDGFQAEISRLQLGLAELIERSNNPLRATQALREDLEAKLKEALRIKAQREEELATARHEWEQEKIHLAAEMVKLRRSAEGKSKSRFPEDSGQEELQNRLKETTRTIESLEGELAKARAGGAAAGNLVAAETARLQEQLFAGRRQIESDSLLIQQLKEHADERNQALHSLQSDQSAERLELAGQLEQSRAEIGRIRGEFERELETAKGESESRKEQLSAEIAQLQKQLTVLSAQAAANLAGSEQLQEVMQQRNFLQQQVHQAEEAIRTVRAEHSTESAQLTSQLEKSHLDANDVRKSLEGELQLARDEAEKLHQQLAAEATVSEGMSEQIQEVLRQRNVLELQVHQIEEEIRTIRAQQSTESAQLTSQLEQSHLDAYDVRKSLESELQLARDEAEQFRQQLAAETAVSEGMGEQIQEVLQQRNTLELQVHQREEEIRTIRTQQSTESVRLTSQLEQSRAEANDLRNNLGSELQLVRDEAERLRQQLAAGTTISQTAIEQIQEVLQQRNVLEQQVHQAEEAIRTVRAERAAECAQLTSQLEQSRIEASDVRASLEGGLQLAGNEAEQLRQELAAAAVAGREAATRQLQEVTQHNILEQQLRQTEELVRTIHREHAQEREQWAAEHEKSLMASRTIRNLELELQAAKREAANRQDDLSAEIEELRQQSAKENAETAAASGAQVQLQEVLQERNFLTQQVHQAQEAIQSIRTDQAAERAQLTMKLEQAHSQMQHLERKLAETNGSVNVEVIDQLRKQYDEKFQEIVQQKSRLADELSTASSMLESERRRLETAGKPVPEPGSAEGRIREELSRVEEVIERITVLIDDPSIELSTVIRKNVERAEWDAYLKGILFSLGRGKGM